MLSLTQLELRGDTVEEADSETFDEKKCSFKKGLNSILHCLPLLNLEAGLPILIVSSKCFLKLN